MINKFPCSKVPKKGDIGGTCETHRNTKTTSEDSGEEVLSSRRSPKTDPWDDDTLYVTCSIMILRRLALPLNENDVGLGQPSINFVTAV